MILFTNTPHFFLPHITSQFYRTTSTVIFERETSQLLTNQNQSLAQRNNLNMRCITQKAVYLNKTTLRTIIIVTCTFFKTAT